MTTTNKFTLKLNVLISTLASCLFTLFSKRNGSKASYTSRYMKQNDFIERLSSPISSLVCSRPLHSRLRVLLLCLVQLQFRGASVRTVTWRRSSRRRPVVAPWGQREGRWNGWPDVTGEISWMVPGVSVGGRLGREPTELGWSRQGLVNNSTLYVLVDF